MSTRRRIRPDRSTVVKDVILFGVGLAMLIHQGFIVSRMDFNWAILSAGMVITQVPGAMAMVGILRTGGGSSEVPPPVEQSPSESPLPSG